MLLALLGPSVCRSSPNVARIPRSRCKALEPRQDFNAGITPSFSAGNALRVPPPFSSPSPHLQSCVPFKSKLTVLILPASWDSQTRNYFCCDSSKVDSQGETRGAGVLPLLTFSSSPSLQPALADFFLSIVAIASLESERASFSWICSCG